MSNLKLLKSVKSRNDLAVLLNYPLSALTYSIYKVPQENRYHTFEIPKKGGGVRTIQAPCPELKGLQSRLSNLLYACHRELFPPQANPLWSYSHGFQKNRNLTIFSNAAKHQSKRYVLNADLKDFFPSINFGRVRGYFQKNRGFELDPEIATLIAQIACHEGTLPQGAPSSPIISELIASILDQRLGRLAKRYKCTYSRYVDDLTFSTNMEQFPKEIAHFVASPPKPWPIGRKLQEAHNRADCKLNPFKRTTAGSCALGPKVLDVIKKSGFEINPAKTRMQLSTSRQSATGLVVNQKVNVAKQYSDTVRAMCHSQFTTSKCHHPETGVDASLSALKGKLEFLMAAKCFETGVLPYHDLEQAASSPNGSPIPSHYKLYRKFLAYEKFHALERPLLICEGKTDNIYIRCAIAALSAGFPSLQPTKVDNDRTRQALSFFKHSEKHAKLLSISGGTGELHKFVSKYGSLVGKFHEGGQKKPVIVLVDNDKAAKPMWSVIRDQTGSKTPIDGSEPFYHVTRNLFVVPIPIPAGTSASIEDLFDKATLATVNRGKTFKRELKSHQTKNHYGKEIFARWVVEANAAKIDFSGFKPLLQRIETVLAQPLKPSAKPTD